MEERPTGSTFNTSVQQKLKCKNAANAYRFGSPNLRNVLRERCRNRIKEARQNAFAEGRLTNATTENRINLENILRQEISELESDIILQDDIYRELFGNLSDWFEKEEKYMIEVSEDDSIVCPLCQLRNLVIYSTSSEFNYCCECNANFMSNLNFKELRFNLYEKIDMHGRNCLKGLNFFIHPISKQLEAICEDCDYLYSF